MGRGVIAPRPMNVFEHFACHRILPVKLKDVKDHILEAGMVDRIRRVPLPANGYLLFGGYHQYRDLKTNERVALIAYPDDHGEGLARLVTVKEMLHVVDPHDATAPTKDKVGQLIDDLLKSGAEKALGVPAYFDRRALFMALTILLPRDALDERRGRFKKGELTAEQIATEAVLPIGFVQFALRDDWQQMLDRV